MTEPMNKDQVLDRIRQEVAELRRAASLESDSVKREYMLHDADTREDLAEDEAEAIAAEIAGTDQQAAISVRVPQPLAYALRVRAESEQVSISVLVRRILTEAMQRPAAPVLTAEQVELVEEIARRVYRESA